MPPRISALLPLARALALALALAPFAAHAQSPATGLDDPDDNGRYQLVQGVVSAGPGASEQRLTLMIDTQAGRVWMLTIGPEGVAFTRLPLKYLVKLPDGMTLRPGPLAPFITPK